MINHLQHIKQKHNDMKDRMRETKELIDNLLRIWIAKDQVANELATIAARRNENHLNIDFIERIDEMIYHNVYTDGSLSYSDEGLAISGGGYTLGKNQH